MSHSPHSLQVLRGVPCEILLAAGDRQPGRRRLAVGGEHDSQRRQLTRQAHARGRLLHRPGLWSRRVRLALLERKALRLLEALETVVVRLEISARHRPVLIAAVAEVLVHERPLVLAEHHVCVDQRPPAEAACRDDVQRVERPQVEQPVAPRLGRPEVRSHVIGRARERSRRVRLAPLEHEDRDPGLGQSHGGERSPEARTDHDHIEVLLDGHRDFDCSPCAQGAQAYVPNRTGGRLRVKNLARQLHAG